MSIPATPTHPSRRPGLLACVGAGALLAMAALPLFAQDAASATTTNASASPTLQTGRELSKLFLQGDTDAVWARMTPQMRAALGDAPALAGFRAKVGQDLGEEREVIDESEERQQGVHIYLRTARWSKAPMPILMQWAFDDDGRVGGFVLQPKPQVAPSKHLDYRTKADLRLPFEGDWYVFWGGRTIEQNYHAASPGQRFAYDLVRRVDGSSHRGDGSALEDYYCWNERILAPAAGTVVEVVDDLPDQAIGTRNPEAPAGNHVMLDLGNGEYALLAHMRKGSVAVETGQKIASGAELGRCGNSGNTSEPHLHVHLQDSPTFGEGEGLPAFFNHYLADGKAVERGEPVKGQTISPAPAAAR
jgi:hypothetical protein